jgi:hypothetical protein
MREETLITSLPNVTKLSWIAKKKRLSVEVVKKVQLGQLSHI